MFGEEREFYIPLDCFIVRVTRVAISPLLGIPSLFRILRRVGFSPDLNLLNILLIVIYFSKWVE